MSYQITTRKGQHVLCPPRLPGRGGTGHTKNPWALGGAGPFRTLRPQYGLGSLGDCSLTGFRFIRKALPEMEFHFRQCFSYLALLFLFLFSYPQQFLGKGAGSFCLFLVQKYGVVAQVAFAMGAAVVQLAMAAIAFHAFFKQVGAFFGAVAAG